MVLNDSRQLPAWVIRAALKNPLWADRTVLCAEKCVSPGPTWRVTSGLPLEWIWGWGAKSRGLVKAGGSGAKEPGPNDNQALYSEYIFPKKTRHQNQTCIMITMIYRQQLLFRGNNDYLEATMIIYIRTTMIMYSKMLLV